MCFAQQKNGLRAVFLCLLDLQILQKSLVGVLRFFKKIVSEL